MRWPASRFPTSQNPKILYPHYLASRPSVNLDLKPQKSDNVCLASRRLWSLFLSDLQTLKGQLFRRQVPASHRFAAAVSASVAAAESTGVGDPYDASRSILLHFNAFTGT